METVKRLWAICISVGIVILTAFPCALFVDTGEWYASLALPSFALPDEAYTPVWALIYILDITALTTLFTKGASGLRLWLPLTAGVFNVFWCYVFFRMKSVIAGAVVLGIIVAYTYACAATDFKRYRIASVLLFLKGAFFSYLFAVAIAIK